MLISQFQVKGTCFFKQLNTCSCQLPDVYNKAWMIHFNDTVDSHKPVLLKSLLNNCIGTPIDFATVMPPNSNHSKNWYVTHWELGWGGVVKIVLWPVNIVLG